MKKKKFEKNIKTSAPGITMAHIGPMEKKSKWEHTKDDLLTNVWTKKKQKKEKESSSSRKFKHTKLQSHRNDDDHYHHHYHH